MMQHPAIEANPKEIQSWQLFPESRGNESCLNGGSEEHISMLTTANNVK